MSLFIFVLGTFVCYDCQSLQLKFSRQLLRKKRPIWNPFAEWVSGRALKQEELCFPVPFKHNISQAMLWHQVFLRDRS